MLTKAAKSRITQLRNRMEADHQTTESTFSATVYGRLTPQHYATIKRDVVDRVNCVCKGKLDPFPKNSINGAVKISKLSTAELINELETRIK